jgi:hypothetical protein
MVKKQPPRLITDALFRKLCGFSRLRCRGSEILGYGFSFEAQAFFRLTRNRFFVSPVDGARSRQALAEARRTLSRLRIQFSLTALALRLADGNGLNEKRTNQRQGIAKRGHYRPCVGRAMTSRLIKPTSSKLPTTDLVSVEV